MQKVKVKLFQSLVDIAVQQYGTADGVVAIANANNISITDTLTVDAELKIPEFENTKPKILKYYAENNIIPATAEITEEIADIVEEGEADSIDNYHLLLGIGNDALLIEDDELLLIK